MAPGIQKTGQSGVATKTAAAINNRQAKINAAVEKILIFRLVKVQGTPIVNPQELNGKNEVENKKIIIDNVLSWTKEKGDSPKTLVTAADIIKEKFPNAVRDHTFIAFSSGEIDQIFEDAKNRNLPAHERALVNSVELSEKGEVEKAKTPIAKTLNIGNTSEIDQTQVAQLQLKPLIKVRGPSVLAQLILDSYKLGALA